MQPVSCPNCYALLYVTCGDDDDCFLLERYVWTDEGFRSGRIMFPVETGMMSVYISAEAAQFRKYVNNPELLRQLVLSRAESLQEYVQTLRSMSRSTQRSKEVGVRSHLTRD